MARTFSKISKQILTLLDEDGPTMLHDIYYSHIKAKSQKIMYNTVYRLKQQGLITLTQKYNQTRACINPEGTELIHTLNPKKDGIWKIVIFDIPESKRYVRAVLRAKLQSLGFKKWQNSIWISPYKLTEDIEQELHVLSKKFFVRLIKTTDINNTEDLEKIF